MRKQNGFSLIELLIVVAIILIIVGIAVPAFLQSRMAANEASAVASLRNIGTAQIAYSSTYPSLGFASNLNTLGPGSATNTTVTSTNALLLDIVLGCPVGVGTTPCPKSGYNFIVTPAGTVTPILDYSANANPTSPGNTGQRYFFTDSSQVVRYNMTAIASSTDAPIQ